jgi:hypothetical protein
MRGRGCGCRCGRGRIAHLALMRLEEAIACSFVGDQVTVPIYRFVAIEREIYHFVANLQATACK